MDTTGSGKEEGEENNGERERGDEVKAEAEEKREVLQEK